MTGECYICKRNTKDIDGTFKEVLIPFRTQVKDLEKDHKKIVKAWKAIFNKFKKTHEGKDYLDLTFQTIKTDKEQFSKMIPDLDEFFQYQMWRTYHKLNLKIKLGEVVDFVQSKGFWELDLKKKYMNKDPRIELKRMMEEKLKWIELIERFEINDYSMKMFKKHDFDFLDKEMRKKWIEDHLERVEEVPICPICKDMLSR